MFSYVPLILIFLSQFVLGIGNTLYFSLGQTYIDDNTKQRNTAQVLSYALAMRMIGPIIGFGFAYLTMSIYIDPTKTPIIARDDPRWLGKCVTSSMPSTVTKFFFFVSSITGAWWLGWLILGSAMFIFAGLIGLFPKNLPKKKKIAVEYEIDGEKCAPSVEIADKHDDDDVKLKSKCNK